MLKNPKKADLDKDGKLSSYEKRRGMAIEKNMKVSKVRPCCQSGKDDRIPEAECRCKEKK